MRLAILGSYGHCGVVLGSLKNVPEVSLVAAARYGSDDPLWFVGHHPAVPAGLPVFDDYRKLLDEAKPDVVAVFMPLYRMAEASIAAAQRDCHILSEKPLAIELADLAALRQAVSKAGVRIIALLNMRANPVYQAIRQVVASGRIGRPIFAVGQKSYPFDHRDDYYKKRETYGGSIPWQAIHAIDFVSYCSGLDYARTAAMHSNAAHPTHGGMEDNGGILLEFRGGGHAVISFDYLRPWSGGQKGRKWGDDRLRIVGTDAAVETMDGERVELLTPTVSESIPLPPARDFFAEFIRSIANPKAADALITPEESFRMTEVALKARQGADTGTVVDL